MKVNICMITYNHEKYISQAIDSVLAQKTNFDLQLIIGEDCSQDKTREIVINYQKKYPQKIRLLLAKKNQGMMGNWVKNLQAVKSKYLAVLEGDDYWTDPYKLQKQVDFLDKHPDYSLCFHSVEAFYQDQSDKTYLIPSKTRSFNFKSLLQQNFIAACSVMYRHGLVKKIPDWLLSLNIGDWPYHLLYASQGEIGFINQVMARYRRHSNSYCSQPKINNFQDIIKFYQVIDKHFDYKYRSIIKPMIDKHYFLIAQEQFQDHKMRTTKDWLKLFIKLRPGHLPV